MANRHLSRSIALQSLYEWDFNGMDDSRLGAVVARNIAEFGPGISDTKFIKDLTHGVVEKRAKLDKILESAAKEWPLVQTPVIDRNVLRLGLYELLFGNRDEVPTRVAINEAIELAKSYGGENSGRFVNGVLGTIYKELGEPGKDDPVKPKIKVPEEKLAGAVVYTRDEKGSVWFALVHDVFGHWTLSKGHLEGEEKEEEAVVREIKEEIGVDVNVFHKLGENVYTAYHPEKGKLKKIVSYYLAESPGKPVLKLKETGGLDDARWFKMTDLEGLKMYNDILPIITDAIKWLNSQNLKKA